jgi:hypothetical protein
MGKKNRKAVYINDRQNDTGRDNSAVKKVENGQKTCSFTVRADYELLRSVEKCVKSPYKARGLGFPGKIDYDGRKSITVSGVDMGVYQGVIKRYGNLCNFDLK